MDTQINVGVIEAIGTGALEAVAIGGEVLASDVGGGGGAVPLVAEVARGKVNELAEEVIGSAVGGSIAEATRGMVAAPTTPQASGLVQSHWVHSAYDLNMAIYSSFAELILVYDIEHIRFIGMLSLEEVQTLYNYETYDVGRNGSIALPIFVFAFELALSNCDNDIIEVQQLNPRVHTQETIQKMPNPNTVELEETVQEIPAQEIPILALRNPRRGYHKAFHKNVLQMTTWKSSSATMHKQVRPLSPTASVREVAVLIGDYMQLLDATSQELYMLDQWIHGQGQLTFFDLPDGQGQLIFFDLPDGMPLL
ncbi:hypothetical protein SELMODRAFT_422041 [Selaginella moellendorffii]|uniref:Uncharacterized protein n=1 Tax=Selaginella moellendorffii TaxID=88036 RepID=D8SH58_SELML|nr:hypothetical protein SELMODRAFT_422041 [Selaginella moellendorffii]